MRKIISYNGSLHTNIENVFDEDVKEYNPKRYKYDSELVTGVFEGDITPKKLPNELYDFTFEELMLPVSDGFGIPIDFEENTKRYTKAVNFKQNINLFSGAKTFQNVLELSNNVFDAKGFKRSFSDFKKIAESINHEFNVNWLKTEQNMAFRQSQSAESWLIIKEDQDVFPLLKYQTVLDGRVRDDHARIDNVVKPVNSKFWNTWFPPNGWNCRCIVIQLEENEESVTRGSFGRNKDKTFGSNTGKRGMIFPKTHPYFKVPKEYKKENKNNFGLKMDI